MNFDVIEVVVDKLVRTFRLKEWEYNLEDFVEDLADALKLIGAAKLFSERTCELTVYDNTVRLPGDLQHIKTFNPNIPYTQVGQFININLSDDSIVTVTYQAMPIDNRGYILVPDNAAVREALMWYMVKNLILGGIIKSVGFEYAEAEWQWRCGSARAELSVMGIQAWDKVEKDFTRLDLSSRNINPNINYLLDREKNRT